MIYQTCPVTFLSSRTEGAHTKQIKVANFSSKHVVKCWRVTKTLLNKILHRKGITNTLDPTACLQIAQGYKRWAYLLRPDPFPARVQCLRNLSRVSTDLCCATDNVLEGLQGKVC
jgi:hypothetical protein